MLREMFDAKLSPVTVSEELKMMNVTTSLGALLLLSLPI